MQINTEWLKGPDGVNQPSLIHWSGTQAIYRSQESSPRFVQMAGFAEHQHLQLFGEKGVRSHCNYAVQAPKEEQKKSLKAEET